MRKAIFRRGLNYAAVKPVKHQGRTFQPGDLIEGLKTHHLRWLWRRGRIGVVGDEWTNDQVKAWRERVAREEAAAQKEREAAAPAQPAAQVEQPPAATAVAEPPAPTPPPPPAAKPQGPRRVRQG